MAIIDTLSERYGADAAPFLIHQDEAFTFANVMAAAHAELDDINAGDVVALVGDFTPGDIQTMLRLIDRAVILVPLTVDTRPQHDTFLAVAGVDVVVEGGTARRIRERPADHPLLDELRRRGHGGLILFSSGTTGTPKAILHDIETFLARFHTPRPALRTLSFLLFDHIGGINTLLHTLFNQGVVIIPSGRTPQAILADIETYNAELLPTTPTFLRLMLMSGMLDRGAPPSLKLITYGTERMDQPTLSAFAGLLPDVDIRQTYGMSELGILRIKSRARDSLWMKIGGEGVTTKVVDGILKIRAENRMIGYLNASSPFDEAGWYDTRDMVEQDGTWLRVVGRAGDLISVGGIKVLPAEIERAALAHPGVLHAHAAGVANPLTGQHIEVTCEAVPGFSLDRRTMRSHFQALLPENVQPHRIKIGPVTVNHRFKRA